MSFEKCYWKMYQESGKTEDLTRWLKHRAYMHWVSLIHPRDPNREITRFSKGHY